LDLGWGQEIEMSSGFLSLKIQLNHTKKQILKRKNQLRMWSHLKVYHSIQMCGLGCAFGVVGKILMSKI
jgi:hypothetical protein